MNKESRSQKYNICDLPHCHHSFLKSEDSNNHETLIIHQKLLTITQILGYLLESSKTKRNPDNAWMINHKLTQGAQIQPPPVLFCSTETTHSKVFSDEKLFLMCSTLVHYSFTQSNRLVGLIADFPFTVGVYFRYPPHFGPTKKVAPVKGIS